MPVNPSHNLKVRFIKYWLPVLAGMVFIFVSSSLPGKDIPSLFPFQDVLFHLAIYALLAYFFARALKNTYSGLTLSKIIYFTVVFGLAYGLTDELHQLFVPGRCASGLDLLTDGLGSFLGSLVYRWPR